jgi:hypothetical protein
MKKEAKIIIENTLVISENKIKSKEIKNNLREQNRITLFDLAPRKIKQKVIHL